MNPKLKAKWVKALCSGKYPQQSDGELKNDKGYCCLGVLGELAGRDIDGRNYLRSIREDEQFRWHLLPDSKQRALAVLNDNGVPFEMIAGLIEEAL